MNKNTQAGFTLIELMVVVGIVAILSAISYPSYREYMARGDRAEARGVLLQAAQYMTRFYGANDSYSSDRAGNTLVLPGAVSTSPTGLGVGAAKYQIDTSTAAIDLIGANSFTLIMKRVPNSSAALDKCGDFTVTNLGVRNIQNQATGVLAADCWK